MRLTKFVKFREEKFGGVLFETRSEKVFALNPTAAAVVREIAVGGDEYAIAARLTDSFAGRDAVIEREVSALVVGHELAEEFTLRRQGDERECPNPFSLDNGPQGRIQHRGFHVADANWQRVLGIARPRRMAFDGLPVTI